MTTRGLPFALAALALLVNLLMPPGYMPGTSLARPIMLCDGGGAMPAMAGMSRDDRHMPGKAPAKAPGGMGDHDCPFAASAASGPAPHIAAPALPAPLGSVIAPAARPTSMLPGRGLAAPPPPSHAPPPLHA